MSSNPVILKVERLTHRFGNANRSVEVFREIEFEIAAKQVAVIQGESGSGKTTLLLDCGGMQKPTSGTISINQQAIFEMSPGARTRFRAANIGYLFQTLELIPYLSLLDNVRMVPGVDTQTAIHWLERLGLKDRRNHKPETLSHGQRQRGALARAIAHRPSLLLADEPTGNLDPENTRLVFQTLREIADDGTAVLLATHESDVDAIADFVLRIEAGTMAGVKESQ